MADINWREKYVEARTDVNMLKSQVYLLRGDLDRIRTDRNDWRMIAAIGWLWSLGLFGLWWLV